MTHCVEEIMKYDYCKRWWWKTSQTTSNKTKKKKKRNGEKYIYVCSERKKNEQMNRVLVYIVHALLTFFSISIPVR